MRQSHPLMFRDREEAAQQLAALMRGRDWRNPIVLAIPRGGVVTGAVLARELGAELDVVLSRKLRMPHSPEFAIGAVGENGSVFLHPTAPTEDDLPAGYLEAETRFQVAEIARRSRMIRQVQPAARLAGRSVIVTDDGIATGSTMIAALQTARTHQPHELIAAVPVSSPDRLIEVRRWCDDVFCLTAPDNFHAVGQFYEDFSTVEDEEVLRLLQSVADDTSQTRNR